MDECGKNPRDLETEPPEGSRNAALPVLKSAKLKTGTGTPTADSLQFPSPNSWAAPIC
jgi:hypothetical protein